MPRRIAIAVAQNEPTINNKDPRAIRSRQALHDALLKLLQEKPLKQITIRDITATAGIGYTTFFRHHQTKESLLGEIAADQIGYLLSLSLPVMDAHDVRAGTAALFAFVKANRPLWTTLLTGGAAGMIREEFIRQAQEVKKERMPPGAPLWAEAGVVLIVSGTVELIQWWLKQADSVTVGQMAEILDELMVSPIIAANINKSVQTQLQKQPAALADKQAKKTKQPPQKTKSRSK